MSKQWEHAGCSVSLKLLDNGIQIAWDEEDVEVTSWRDVLGATAKESELTIDLSPYNKHGQRFLENIVVCSQDKALVKRYEALICYYARHDFINALPEEEILTKIEVERKCLVLINPVGGTGNALKMFKQVKGIFKAARINAIVKLTEHAGHATELAMELDLKLYEFVVCVGGDGLLSEVVQGLMKRKDWSDAIQLPLGIIPGGSGNGLAKSMIKHVKEEFYPENCAYLIVKGSPQPIDMMTTRNETETFISFLSLAWAFIADVDLDSETYRFLGGLRFTVSAVAKVLSRKRWYGTVSYLPADNASSVSQYQHKDGTVLTPNFLPPIQKAKDSVPKGWKTIKGPFSFFWATSAAYPSSDCYLAPQAHINDGYIYIVVVPENVSLLTQAKLLLSLETGKHVEYPQVQVIKTRAYQLHRDDSEYVSVDGERLSGSTIQVEIHRGLGRIMSLPL
ncbi:sphingosine kinase [Thraustotheca clavata]|uniref:Sphingosine kinase n=1 Tax=Thraustotheca clavata TaxID=74557 RepID=A0A1W0AAN8_9STRA|nr:sphingosine kinase [Thraustotheca clavata]